MDFDYGRLAGDQLFKPERPAPGAARRALRHGADPIAVWRGLFGPDDPRRRFRHSVVCGSCRGKGVVGHYDQDGEWEPDSFGCGRCAASGDGPDSTVDGEPDANHVLALGDCVEAVCEAEAQALEAAARLVPWGAPAVRWLQWRVANPDHHARGGCFQGFPWSFQAGIARILDPRREGGLAGAESAVHAGIGLEWWKLPHPASVVHELALRHAYWQRAADLDLRVPDGDRPAGRSFADLPNPYTPLLKVWLAGFAVDRVTDDSVILYAPPPRD